jgi:hypothetical protein
MEIKITIDEDKITQKYWSGLCALDRIVYSTIREEDL